MQHIEEKITWIIDGIDKADEYENAISFVHSFGLKCDSVGWCSVKLNDEKVFDLLKQIKAEAKNKKGRTRCYYEKTETGIETDWYILTSNRKCDYEYNEGIKAYKLSPNDNVAMAEDVLVVNQSFVDFCVDKGFSGIDFAYMRDIGRYQANAYYALLPSESVKYCSVIGDRISGDKKAYKLIDSFGGNLSRVAECFDKMYMIDYPLMISKEDEPKADFCYVAYKECAEFEILLRSNVANALVDNKLISQSNLIPVRYCEHKKLLCKSVKREIISQEIIDYWKENRELFEKKKKPLFIPNEKDALSMLRQAKKQRPEDFSKPLSKVYSEEIDENLSVLKPIFKVSNGCYINDDIQLLPYLDIASNTKDFFNMIKNEELAMGELNLENGYVIGNVLNGDKVILNNDNSVIIYDHEECYSSKVFKSVWEFLFAYIDF